MGNPINRVAQKVTTIKLSKNRVNEIRFICQIKVTIKHYNSIGW